ncbi:MAG: transketolase [Clostridia bacterium]|nr:transketolase [Clostridia bacterium]
MEGNTNSKYLENICKDVRKNIVKMIYHAKSGHPGGSLSCVEILVSLYKNIMNITLDESGKRVDKFVLSKGHASAAYYAILSECGFIPKEDLVTFRKYDSYLEGHPSNKIPGVDVSSGSLGQGLSVANGMALAKKLDHKEGYVYCLLGDGELEEGQIWEACMSANKYNLNNLIVFVDYNGLQIDGSIKDVKDVDNLNSKFESFGLNVQKINGNNIEEIIEAVKIAKEKLNDRPNVIVAKTIKGKGVSFMENKIEWHGKTLTKEELEIALNELN